VARVVNFDNFDYGSYPPSVGTLEDMRVVARNNELVRLAAMSCMHPPSDKEDASKLAQLNAADLALVNFAAKIFRGEPHEVSTDDSETVHRHRLIARHVGATVEVIERRGVVARIVFRPPFTR
jgi:hypothetical protein